MHVETKIKPALSEGKIVICDRFTDSTIAYQGYGHGFDLNILRNIQKLAIDDFEPTKTFILDIDVKDGLARAGKRMAGDNNDETEDRFERMKMDFHERLRQGYLEIARQNPHRCVVINALQSIESVHSDILSAINL
jgi:dTMP kinase